ncbi:MAG: pyridoxal phosphate-dependent aminotransferase [Synergistaceae bacterium]|nr:pyridoxal phosphate-dependent aminotransferase [Synergistaceae bacterium]
MELKFSKRSQKIKPSATLAVAALARDLKASGRPVLSFSAGEPDFPSPKPALDAAREAMDRSETHYTANSGIPELKRAVAGYYKKRFGLEYSPREIIISGGAKQILYEALQTLADPADEVLLPAPGWVSYIEQVQMAEGGVSLIETSDTGFAPVRDRVESALSDKTAGMIINTPNNPTGAVYGEDTLKMLADVAREHDLWIIFDEIYERLVYGNAAHKNILQIAPDIRDRVLTVNGVSKAYSMTGWRIGYALGPKEIISKMDDIQSHLTSNPSSISQWASVGAIEQAESDIELHRTEFERRRDILCGSLSGVGGIRLTRPDGAFYLFFDVRGSKIPDDMEFCRRILEEKYVALVPGTSFMAPGFIRMSYACSERELLEGASRIKEFMQSI